MVYIMIINKIYTYERGEMNWQQKYLPKNKEKILSKNPNVESVEKTRIIYTEAFKSYYVKNYLAGKKPTENFY